MRRTCACGCGTALTGRPDKRYASEACSKRARRAERDTGRMAPPSPDGSLDGQTVRAVRAELTAAGQEDTYLAAAAVAVAQRIDAADGVMGLAALVKELRATMADALKGAQVAESAVDELRRRRDAKRGA